MRALYTAVAGGVLLLAVGCTGNPGAGATASGPTAAGSGTVTSSTASATPAVSAPALTAPALTAPAMTAPPPTVAGSTAASSGQPSPTTRSSAAVSSSRTRAPATTPPRTTPVDTRTVAAPHTTTPKPAAVPTANVTAAGPDDGPPCAVDPQYSDEAPTGLRPDVLIAWVAVKKYAKSRGVVLCLNDGKRSTAQQLALYDDYVKRFGRAAADVYVLPPAKSAHVKGYAVDVQPAAAYEWLQATKGARGWCRIYDNEPWHFEYSRGYQSAGCPARLPMPVR